VDPFVPPLVFAVVLGVVWYGFSAAMLGKSTILVLFLVAYGLLTALALWRMWRDGTLLDLFRFRSGDIALGAAVALFLGGTTFVGRQVLAPRGSPGDALVMRLYAQLGELPEARGKLILVSVGVALVAVLEEIVWRGLVQQVLEERLGVKKGWLGTAALYALAHVPSVWLLAMPGAGKNPLVLMAAAFCGVVWGFLVGRMQRLPPALISHAVFTYGMAVQFRLWP